MTRHSSRASLGTGGSAVSLVVWGAPMYARIHGTLCKAFVYAAAWEVRGWRQRCTFVLSDSKAWPQGPASLL